MNGDALSQELRLTEPMVRLTQKTFKTMRVQALTLLYWSGSVRGDEVVLEQTARWCSHLGGV